MYYWCEEYYKPTTVQYHISDYVSWILRLTLLYLQTSWTYYHVLFVTLWTVARTDSSVHGIFQARILEWVAISFSRGSSSPTDRTRVSRIVGRHFTF